MAALLDTKGPEIRLRDFKNGTEMLEAGQTFTLTTREVEGTKEICSITYKDLPQDVQPGGTIMLDDGLIKLQIQTVNDTAHSRGLTSSPLPSCAPHRTCTTSATC